MHCALDSLPIMTYEIVIATAMAELWRYSWMLGILYTPGPILRSLKFEFRTLLFR